MKLVTAVALLAVVVSSGPAGGQTSVEARKLMCFGSEPSWSVRFDGRGQARVTGPGVQVETAPLEGSWRLVSLPGHPAPALAALPRPVSLRLDAGRVTGFSGCNTISGTYTMKGNAITFGRLASTMMACPEPASSVERTLSQALQGTLSHAVTGSRLSLTAASGAVLDFEREPPPTLEGRTWTVTGYNNGRQAVVTPIADSRLTLSFENGTISGQAGCNTFRATYSTERNRITIGAAAATRKMCADALMGQERDFLKALESATRWTVDGGLLTMHRAGDERVLTARPSGAQ